MTQKIENYLEKLAESELNDVRSESPRLKADFRARIKREFGEDSPSVSRIETPPPIPIESIASSRRFQRSIVAVMAVAAAAVLAIAVSPLYFNSSQGSQAAILFSAGSYELSDAGSGNALAVGSRIKTKDDGKALFSMDRDRVQVYLEPNTTAVVASNVDLSNVEGQVWVSVKSDSGYFGLGTLDGKIEVTGTSFAVSSNTGETRIYLASGSISFKEVAGDTIKLESGQTLVVQGEKVSTEEAPQNGPDWVHTIYQNYQIAYNEAYFPSAKIQRVE